ncbi:MAG: acyl carrier protein [Clostridia bacterium]
MVFERFQELVHKQLGIDKSKITRETDIIKDIGADSLDIVELLMEAEAEWKITIDDADVQNLKTIGDIVDYIEKSIK